MDHNEDLVNLSDSEDETQSERKKVPKTENDEKSSGKKRQRKLTSECKHCGITHNAESRMGMVMIETKYPTSNLYFSNVIKVRVFLHQEKDSQDKFMSKMASRMRYEKVYGVGYSDELSLMKEKLVSLFNEYKDESSSLKKDSEAKSNGSPNDGGDENANALM
ncbi:Alanyl-tRNA editing protein AlaX-M, partial [Bienertia sinuspersici]